jgi:hypothetical protein
MQSAKEPHGKFPVTVNEASFPTKQTLSEHTHLTIQVRNTGTETIPNIAVTICNRTCTYPADIGQGTSAEAFSQVSNQKFLANPSRPIWIVDTPPGTCGYSCRNGGEGSAVSAYANTWAMGPLKAGHTALFSWKVTAVSPGHHVVAWQIAAGLNGKARAVLSDGSAPRGTFNVNITPKPAQQYVNNGGQIVSGSGQ